MWITNNSDKKLIDGYDGEKYEFLPGKSIEVPDIVARHVFGFGDDNKLPYLARLGWLTTEADFEKGLERLYKFSFSMEEPKPIVHSLSPVVESSPLPIPQKKGRGVVRLAA